MTTHVPKYCYVSQSDLLRFANKIRAQCKADFAHEAKRRPLRVTAGGAAAEPRAQCKRCTELELEAERLEEECAALRTQIAEWQRGANSRLEGGEGQGQVGLQAAAGVLREPSLPKAPTSDMGAWVHLVDCARGLPIRHRDAAHHWSHQIEQVKGHLTTGIAMGDTCELRLGQCLRKFRLLSDTQCPVKTRMAIQKSLQIMSDRLHPCMKKLREEAFHSALSNLDNKLHHTHAVNDAITQLEKIDQLPFADGEERARLMTVLQRCKETVERDMAALSDEADLQALEDRILPVTQELSEYERGLLAIQDNIFTHLGMVMRIVVARKKEEESMTNDFICSNESITCNALQRPVQRRGRPHRRSYKWSLEAVFGGDKTLDDVWASMEVLVENAVSCNESRGGRDLQVFAFGRSGCGKTYTLLEKSESIVPRTLDAMFTALSPGEGLYVKLIEIYNLTYFNFEVDRDALEGALSGRKTKNFVTKKEIFLVEKQKNDWYFATTRAGHDRLRDTKIESTRHGMHLLRTAAQLRRIRDMGKANHNSSRSQFLCQFIIKQEDNQGARSSVLFADMPGNEDHPDQKAFCTESDFDAAKVEHRYIGAALDAVHALLQKRTEFAQANKDPAVFEYFGGTEYAKAPLTKALKVMRIERQGRVTEPRAVVLATLRVASHNGAGVGQGQATLDRLVKFGQKSPQRPSQPGGSNAA